jgi:hypothetical protein
MRLSNAATARQIPNTRPSPRDGRNPLIFGLARDAVLSRGRTRSATSRSRVSAVVGRSSTSTAQDVPGTPWRHLVRGCRPRAAPRPHARRFGTRRSIDCDAAAVVLTPPSARPATRRPSDHARRQQKNEPAHQDPGRRRDDHDCGSDHDRRDRCDQPQRGTRQQAQPRYPHCLNFAGVSRMVSVTLAEPPTRI